MTLAVRVLTLAEAAAGSRAVQGGTKERSWWKEARSGWEWKRRRAENREWECAYVRTCTLAITRGNKHEPTHLYVGHDACMRQHPGQVVADQVDCLIAHVAELIFGGRGLCSV